LAYVAKVPCVGHNVKVNNYNSLCSGQKKALQFRAKINDCFSYISVSLFLSVWLPACGTVEGKLMIFKIVGNITELGPLLLL
jgi:hypothetical protein